MMFSNEAPKDWWVLKTGRMDSAMQLCSECGNLLAAVAKVRGRIKELGVNPPPEGVKTMDKHWEFLEQYVAKNGFVGIIEALEDELGLPKKEAIRIFNEWKDTSPAQVSRTAAERRS
jgi:hypothetical protein